MRISKFGLFAVLMIGGLASSGCTRAIRANYSPQLQASSLSVPVPAQTFAVARFTDRRQWVSGGSVKSQSFIASAGPWKFGISRDGSSYTPVNEFVQDVTIRELNNAGFKATALSTVSDGGNVEELKTAAKGSHYAVGGKILTFEFANDAGIVTVESRRTVSLQLTLVEVASGKPLIDGKVYQEGENTNEGMAVMHSTNVNRLVQGPLLKVVRSIAQDLARGGQVAVNSVEVFLPYAPMSVVRIDASELDQVALAD